MKRFLTCFLLLHSTMTLHSQQVATLNVQSNSNITINRHIYGHFAEHLGRCIYDGFYKDGRIRMDIVEALKKIKVPNLRWPGGCFGDKYHWRDGIGPKEKRPLRVNSTWGMAREDNSFGTHEFLELCELLGAAPYMAANMGTGTPQEMADWVEYLNFGGESDLANLRKKNGHPLPYGVSFWGVGNESWGCGGNMTPEYYSGLYKQYAYFCTDYPGASLKKIAVGPIGADFNWTEVIMKNIPMNQMWGLSLHHYTIPTSNWQNKGSATSFDEREYFNTMREALRMDFILSTNEGIMNRYDPQKRVALVVDEWGVWTNVEPGTNPAFLYQQNSLRDALVAGTTLNIFNNHSERVRVANLAQTVNVLQSLILTEGKKMLLTPTYHVFDMYKVHQDAKWLPVQINSPDYVVAGNKLAAVNASASEDPQGNIHISLVNLDAKNKVTVHATVTGMSDAKITDGQILTSAKFTDINTFDNPGKVVPKRFAEAKTEGNEVIIELPALSVVVVTLNYPKSKVLTVSKVYENREELTRIFNLEREVLNTKDWKGLVEAVSTYLKKGGNVPAPNLNNVAWMLFESSSDKSLLNEASAWMPKALEIDNHPNYIDTYANLLYKLGKKDEAIEWEEKAVSLAHEHDKKMFQDTLDKMKKGEKTWPEVKD